MLAEYVAPGISLLDSREMVDSAPVQYVVLYSDKNQTLAS